MKEQAETLPQLKVPSFLFDALSFLQRYAMDEYGLFFGSASHGQMEILYDKINRREPVKFETECDTRTAAALIVRFFASLPTPIFAGRFEAGYCPASTSVKDLQDLVHSLPIFSQHVICELFALLSDLCLHSSINQTDAHFLSGVFAPILFPKYQDKSSHLFDSEKAVVVMIQQYSEVFRFYISRLSRTHRPSVDIPNLSTQQSPLSHSPSLSNSPRTAKISSQGSSKNVSRSKKDLLTKGTTLGQLIIRASRPLANTRLCVIGEKTTGKHKLVQKLLFDSEANIKTETVYSHHILIDGQVYPVDIVIIDLAIGSVYSTEQYQRLQWAEGFILTINVASERALE
eukprot:TRINITY_DN21926_c0_g1_i1.p1 TRINITY_DN21926_c0_g1~~TRINITY_DN21926_c0_g1_i1.p1  ORF type:complete len:344 (+),score=44.56 TRINITY_DN21926_c0_g1_i1:319-1350(+)